MNKPRDNFKQKFKQKPEDFADCSKARIARAKDLQNKRKEERAKCFRRSRGIANTTEEKSIVTISKPIKMKENKPEKQKKDVKPPFKVGIVHHPIYPTFSMPPNELKHQRSFKNVPQNKKPLNHPIFKCAPSSSQSTVKKISKVTEKRLLAKTTMIGQSPGHVVLKKRRLENPDKNENHNKAEVNVTFEKETSNFESIKTENKENNKLKRKSRSFDKEQMIHNETFEKDLDGDIKINPSKSIISSAKLCTSAIAQHSNLNVTSFEIPDDQTSTPNISPVQHNFISESKQKSTSKKYNETSLIESIKESDSTTETNGFLNITKNISLDKSVTKDKVDNKRASETAEQPSFEIKERKDKSKKSKSDKSFITNFLDNDKEHCKVEDSTFEIKDRSYKDEVNNKSAQKSNEISINKCNKSTNKSFKRKVSRSFDRVDENEVNDKISECSKTALETKKCKFKKSNSQIKDNFSEEGVEVSEIFEIKIEKNRSKKSIDKSPTKNNLEYCKTNQLNSERKERSFDKNKKDTLIENAKMNKIKSKFRKSIDENSSENCAIIKDVSENAKQSDFEIKEYKSRSKRSNDKSLLKSDTNNFTVESNFKDSSNGSISKIKENEVDNKNKEEVSNKNTNVQKTKICKKLLDESFTEKHDTEDDSEIMEQSTLEIKNEKYTQKKSKSKRSTDKSLTNNENSKVDEIIFEQKISRSDDTVKEEEDAINENAKVKKKKKSKSINLSNESFSKDDNSTEELDEMTEPSTIEMNEKTNFKSIKSSSKRLSKNSPVIKINSDKNDFENEITKKISEEIFSKIKDEKSGISTKTVTLRKSSSLSELEKHSTVETSLRPKLLRNSLPKSLSEDVGTPEMKQSNVKEFPAIFSPYIVSSRGKSNVRKEQEIRKSLSTIRTSSKKHDIPTKDTVMQNLNISVEEEENTAQYFKFLANREIERLQGLCDKWTAKMDNVGEDGKYRINQAIGQTQLLLRKKMQRFLSLVKDCEDGQGQHLVTCKDLQGFWDMTYIEVENCNRRFNVLAKYEQYNWIDLPNETVEQKPKSKLKSKPKNQPVKKNIIKARPSGIRDMIRAAKLKMKNGTQGDGSNFDTTDESKEKNTTPVPNVPVIRRSSTPLSATKQRQSLNKESPLTMMKISRLYKTPMVELDQSISYINSTQTPGKSILKRIDENLELNQLKKSACKVNFNETVIQNEFQLMEEEANKKSLTEAMAKIESYNVSDDNDENIGNDSHVIVKKKLIFNSSDTEIQETMKESDEEDKENVHEIMAEINKKSNVSQNVSLRRRKKKEEQSKEEEKEEEETIIKNLRNRMIKTPIRASTKNSKLSKNKGESDVSVSDSTEKKTRRMKVSKKLSLSASDDIDSPSISRSTRNKKQSVMSIKTQENSSKKSPKKVVRVKEEFIKYHPSQKRIFPKGTPIKRIEMSMDEIDSSDLSTPR